MKLKDQYEIGFWMEGKARHMSEEDCKLGIQILRKIDQIDKEKRQNEKRNY